MYDFGSLPETNAHGYDQKFRKVLVVSIYFTSKQILPFGFAEQGIVFSTIDCEQNIFNMNVLFLLFIIH